MRQKWEKEEEEAMRRPVGPVHYQNVQFDGKSCYVDAIGFVGNQAANPRI